MNLSNHFFTQSSSAFRNGARFLPKMELEVQDEVLGFQKQVQMGTKSMVPDVFRPFFSFFFLIMTDLAVKAT
ncbi:hypothetical protein I3760_01G145800 [Carya illinoinensis]|nr:hypothetical protein I3760_01G145800 [Carya illinoinensis]